MEPFKYHGTHVEKVQQLALEVVEKNEVLDFSLLSSYNNILDNLIPCRIGFPTSSENGMCFSETSHLVANAYDKVFVKLTRHGFS